MLKLNHFLRFMRFFHFALMTNFDFAVCIFGAFLKNRFSNVHLFVVFINTAFFSKSFEIYVLFFRNV